jgi:two-component system, response regulator PdtaR
MDGLKLAHAIRERWPPIELIFTSGHFDIRKDEIPERGRFFPKPYRDQEIISAYSILSLKGPMALPSDQVSTSAFGT